MIRRFLIVLLLIPTLTQAEVLYEADWENASTTGQASESPTSPTTIADWDGIHRSNPPGAVTVVSNPVRQGRFAGRVKLDHMEESPNNKDTARGVHRRGLLIPKGTNDESDMPYGETRWYAWSLLLPTRNQFQLGDTYSGVGVAHTQTSFSWYDANNAYQNAVSFYMKAQAASPDYPNGTWGVFRWGADGQRYTPFGEPTLGVWHDFLLEYKPHKQTGVAKTYLRYRIKGNPWQTAFNSDVSNLVSRVPENDVVNFNVTIYGPIDDDTKVIYTDGPWIGETEADVLAFFDDEPSQAQLATPAVTLEWEGITWTQSGEANVANWTVQQCWDARACAESTAATKTATVATPLGKSLLVRVRANPAVPATHSPSEWGEDTELRTTPELPTNLALVQHSVTATAVTIPQTVTLSTTGTLDWVHWGLTAVSDVNRKSGATTQIGTMQPIGGGALLWSELASSIYRPIMAWVNGTPTATEADTVNGVTYAYADAVAGSGFRLTAPAAATTQRTLRMWVHANKTLARATVTQGTATTTLDFGSESEQKAYMIAVPYLGTGQMQLDVTKTTVATGTGRLVLLGATLE